MFRFAAKTSVFYLLEIIYTRTGGHAIISPTCVDALFLEVKRPERVAHNNFHILQVFNSALMI